MSPKLSAQELDELHEEALSQVDAEPLELARSDSDNMFVAWRNQRRRHDIPENPPKWDMSTIAPDLEGIDNPIALKHKLDWLMDNALGFCEDLSEKVQAINSRAQEGYAPNPKKILDMFDDIGTMMNHLQRVSFVTQLKTMEHNTDPAYHELERYMGDRFDEVVQTMQEVPSNFALPMQILQAVIEREPELRPLAPMLAGLQRPQPKQEAAPTRQERKASSAAKDPRLADYTELFGDLNSNPEFQQLGKSTQKEQLEGLSEEKKAKIKEERGFDVDEALSKLKDVKVLSEEQQEAIRDRYLDTAMQMINARLFQVWQMANSNRMTPAVMTSKLQGLPNHFVDDMIPNLSKAIDQEGFLEIGKKIRKGRPRPTPPEFEREISWREAVDVVVSGFASIHPELGELARDAFQDNWVHATDDADKFYNPFSTGGVPVTMWTGSHPVILLNFTGTLNDVMTLAHEMGHALAEYVSGEQEYDMRSINSIALHETFAHFAANQAMNVMIDRAADPKEEAAIRIRKVNNSATGITNSGFNGMEYALLAATKHGETLTREDVGRIVRDNLKLVVDSEGWDKLDQMSDGEAIESIAHSFQMFGQKHPPYYNINYAFAEMGAMNLEQKFKEVDGEEREALAESWLSVIRDARGLNYGRAMKRLGLEIEQPLEMLETAQAMFKDEMVAYAKKTVEYLYPEDLVNDQDVPEEDQVPNFLQRLRQTREENKAKAAEEAEAAAEEAKQNGEEIAEARPSFMDRLRQRSQDSSFGRRSN